MSAKSQTTATFAVTIKLPLGTNIQQAQQYIRDAIRSHAGGGSPEDGFFGIQDDWFSVSLVRKVTTYGKQI